MKKKLHLLIICLAGMAVVRAQSSYGTYLFDNDFVPYHLQKVSDGFLSCGSYPDTALNVVKLNTGLVPQWELSLKPAQHFDFVEAMEMKDHSYLIMLSIYDTSMSQRTYVVRISSSGQKLFEKIYGGNSGSLLGRSLAVSAGSDNGFIIVIAICAYGHAIIKCNDMGIVQWQNNYNSTSQPILTLGMPITVSPDGGSYHSFILANTTTTGMGIGVITFDTTGTITNLKHIRTTGNLIRPFKFVQLPDQSYMYYWRMDTGSFGTSGIGLLGSDLTPGPLYRFSSANSFRANDLILLSDGNLVVAGDLNVPSSPARYGMFTKISPTGQVLNTHFSGFADPHLINTYYMNYAVITRLAQTDDGKIVSVFSGMDASGMAVITPDLQGLCRDSTLGVSLVPLNLSLSVDNYTNVGKNAIGATGKDTVTAATLRSVTLYESCSAPAGTSVTEIICNKIELFPNPAINTVTITVDQTMIGSTATITDLTGRTVAAVPLPTAHCLLPTAAFANGIYLVTVTGTGGRSATKKLVVSQ